MNLFFNELSLLPIAENDHIVRLKFLTLLKTFKVAKDDHGFERIIFPVNIGEYMVTQNRTFTQWAYNIPDRKDKNNILSQIKRPFTNEIVEGDFDRTGEYYFDNVELGIINSACIGLASAHISETLSISLIGHPIWENKMIPVKKLNTETLEPEDVLVFNIAKEETLSDVDIINFVENIGEVELVTTEVLPTNKPINLRDDHGADVLKHFAKRINNSVYVEGVINSMPFNPKITRFIRNAFADGSIEIVLHWEDAGYGMVIQTKGRNLRETQAIADILTTEFDE